MGETYNDKTRRIAKNTVLLYARTLLMLLISLYTSRIVLEALGVVNYGINNVVGGVVGMFSIISGSLSGSISRFLTFALGEGNAEKLRKIFSISINIQIAIGLLIIILGEAIGIWFINHKLNIPADRLIAAHWVFQCGLMSFFIGLISVPYNACIIAHERMGVFAYMTILDAVIKLLMAYAIFVTPFDKLITWAILGLSVSILMRIIYGIYCVRHFDECKYRFSTFDKPLVKEMTSFAWWGFFGNTAWMFNTQGVNILINMFFGVVYNAARGVASQVEGAVMGFVNNFTTAINPQITKSYAAGDSEYLFKIVCKGTKFQFYLMLLFLIPLEFEADTVLKIWLVDVPTDSALFLRLALICSLTTLYGNTTYMSIMATGNIKNYQICITAVGCLVFPLTWIAFKLGAPIYSTYIIFIAIYTILIGVRLIYMKKLIGFPPTMFLKDTVLPSIMVSILSIIAPGAIAYILEPSFIRLVILTIIATISTSSVILYIGMTSGERYKVISQVRKHLKIA